VYGDKETSVVGATHSIPLAEKRLARLRQTVATLAGKQSVVETGER